MEHQFETTILSCLDIALQEIQNSEQTQQINLPDSMPDIGSILCAWGQVILRGKEWRGDSISFSGGMMIWVLYAPEDGTQARRIDAWIPFQMKWDLPGDTPEGTIRIKCLTRFVDARSISARKIMVRAGMAAMATAYVPKTLEAYVPNGIPEGVELLRGTYPVRLIKEAGEKTFLQDEEAVLPESAPLPEKVIYYRLSPQITERKVLSDKVVFRGNSNLHVLYRSEEGQLHSWDFDMPFSQYAPLGGSYGADAQAEILPCPTSVELELSDEGRLHLKCGIVAQYLITDKQMLELVEDAYSPGREVMLQVQDLALPALLDSATESVYGEQSISAQANLTADVSFYPDFPRQLPQENGIELEFPGTFQILYYGEDGVLHCVSSHWQERTSHSSDRFNRITVLPLAADAQASVGSGSILAKTEMTIGISAISGQGIPMVTGVELGEVRKPDPGRPSLILRRAGTQRLWDIAKECGSTMDAIRNANQIKDEPAFGQMLLIPVS